MNEDTSAHSQVVPAEDVLRLERALLAHLRHELRTPVNAILGYAEMLLEDCEQAQLAADIKNIHAAGRQLLRLIGELLELDAARLAQLTTDPEGFGAYVRHELCTPVSAIIGYAEMLLEDAGEGTFADDLKKILEAAKRLLELVNDLVNFTEASARGEVPTRLSASALAHDVVAAIKPLAAERETFSPSGRLLVVDDSPTNRELLARKLSRHGHSVATAENGRVALDMLDEQGFDLVLLDMMMPEMNGFEVLSFLKGDPLLRHLPVIMISALDEMDMVVRCIEAGAEDYLPKPFNPVLLKARIDAGLEKKRWRDRERAYLEQLRLEREKVEMLLLNVLPAAIAERLKGGESPIADHFPEATVLFADLVDFTKVSARTPPVEIVRRLNAIFSAFDGLADRFGLEKIKTIGDAYLAVGGLPTPRRDHAEAVAEMALAMLRVMAEFGEHGFEVRIGIHSGPVIAGVIGTKKFAYDLWGDTVNTASRMESHGLPGAIQISEASRAVLKDRYVLECRGALEVKGKGKMTTYWLRGRR